MDTKEMQSIIEGLLFAAGEPVSLNEIASVLSVESKEVLICIRQMKDRFSFERRGVQIVEVDGHFQMCTRPEHYEYFQRFYAPRRKQGLSQAALETLAIIAYKQPVTRAEIDNIRGVKSESAISTLVEKKLISEVDRLDTVGRPILYGTTLDFLKYFGFNSMEELPRLMEEQMTYFNGNTR